MKEEEFMKLSDAQLYEGFNTCIRNANELYEEAVLLAESHRYGTANSLLILCIEEYIKSFVLVAHFLGIDLDFKVSPIFSNHSAKHKQGIEMIPVLNVLSGLSLIINERQNIGSGIASFLMGVSQILLKKEKINEWWKNANKQKNDGFYVDYVAGKWSC